MQIIILPLVCTVLVWPWIFYRQFCFKKLVTAMNCIGIGGIKFLYDDIIREAMCNHIHLEIGVLFFSSVLSLLAVDSSPYICVQYIQYLLC
jgi:hypothetical protein